MTKEDIPAAIYKWGGPWPSKVEATDMSFDPVRKAVLLMWILKPGVEVKQVLDGVNYKFVDHDGNEITRDEWEVLDAKAKEEDRAAADRQADAAATSVTSSGGESSGDTRASEIKGDDSPPTPEGEG